MQNASPDELNVAREGVALIGARGYARGRDLEAALADLIREHGLAGD